MPKPRNQIRHQLNHMAPAARDARLGHVLYDLIDKHNKLAKRMDAAGTALVAATGTYTITGSGFASGDTASITFTNSKVGGLPVTKTYTLGSGETVTTIATGLVNLVNADTTLADAQITAANVAGVLTVSELGTVGNTTVLSGAFSAHGTIALSNSGTLSGGAGTFGTDNFSKFGITPPESIPDYIVQ